MKIKPLAIGSAVLFYFSSVTLAAVHSVVEGQTPAEVLLGERLFKETRFAQYFYAHQPKNLNQGLPEGMGDPVLATTRTLQGNIPGPYRGKSMTCAACHLVGEQRSVSNAGMRSYSDFYRRSLIPVREDGRTETPRNSPTMVNAFIDRGTPFFLHYDGQFTSAEDLVKGAFLGRNFGWLPHEKKSALAHIARVIREDDGTDALAQDYWGSYREIFLSEDPLIPAQFRLPQRYRMDIASASDDEILENIAKLIAAYSRSLVYSRDDQGHYNGSPYDLFISRNHLPSQPRSGESGIQYARRLRKSVNLLSNPLYVTESDGQFQYQRPQRFVFQEKELTGLKIFLSEGKNRRQKGVGNCIACHAPPDFTDFRFHNTGATQDEYDALHGSGSFADLMIPSLEVRNQNPELYLPPSESHPYALGWFMSIPTQDDSRKVDLGLWNVFANPDQPAPQTGLRDVLCSGLKKNNARLACSDESLLESSVSQFKTPSLRDLGQSDPYLHTGQKDQIEDVIRFYRNSSALMRKGKLRNGDPELAAMFLGRDDLEPLTSFLRSLNEDYH